MYTTENSLKYICSVNLGALETVQFLLDSGFVNHWQGNYLTSNVLLEARRQPIGHRYTLLQDKQSNTTVLTFGFLYNFLNHCHLTVVERVEDVVHQEWFKVALTQNHYDAILIMAHMDCVDPLVSVILNATRAIVGENMPIQFVTGHSHRRAYEVLDSAASSMEAGRFLDTVGFVSFPRSHSYIAAQTKAGGHNLTALSLFQHEFIDASKAGLSSALCLDDADSLSTPEGDALSAMIRETQQRLDLESVLGCSPTNFLLSTDWKDPSTLWGLYLNKVVPSQLFRNNGSKVYVQRTGAFRYMLFEGEVSLDDVISVCPFNDTVYEVVDSIQGSTLQDLLKALTNLTSTPDLAVFPLQLDPDRLYAVYVPDWNMPEVIDVISSATGQALTPVPTGKSTTNLWRDFVKSHWPTCDEAASEHQAYTVLTASSPSASEHQAYTVLSASSPSDPATPGFSGAWPYSSIAGLLVLILAWAVHQYPKRSQRMQVLYDLQVKDPLIPSSLAENYGATP